MKKFKLIATADTAYQLQSLRNFGMEVKSHLDGSYSAEKEFDTEKEAKDFLIESAEIYFDMEEEKLIDAIDTINRFGQIRLDASTGRVVEIEEEA
jgi:hypothetical protein